ncbi:PREDICTED: uncharacterized protein LOC109243337 [Nicotiana attenuata]|uniref:uncharacterized protein LOC109243337 n=1 Tax=Nicotiana attenuata TaxID=49451 RepID=UPI000905B322|nr:PREDICTED: uncharacterized protein LOC109243337 [Nicotiana attenuata]
MASSTRIFGNCCRALCAAAKTSASTTTTTATVTKSRGRPNGILKPQPVSPALRKFLGTSEASRTDAVKKVWEYIKTHNLQSMVIDTFTQNLFFSSLDDGGVRANLPSPSYQHRILQTRERYIVTKS